MDALPPEHALLWLTCGLALEQQTLEEEYAKTVRIPLLAQQLDQRLRKLRPHADLDVALRPLEGIGEDAALDDDGLAALVRRVVTAAAAAMDVAELQLEREWSTLRASHSTLANACLAHLLHATNVHLQDATLITSVDPKRARLLVLLYDSVVHEGQQRPRKFHWAPCLSKLVRAPNAEALGREMTDALWAELVSGQGYHPPAELVAALTPLIVPWIASCVTRHGGLAVRATLGPQRHLCLYLHGRAGCGKSSLVRAMLPALVRVIRRYLHPECYGGFVKQALNKQMDHLSLEFERRPNNNDLSVVTVIEMAREPLTASEPRLMMLALEELPDVAPAAPDGTASSEGQHAACTLLAERLRASCHHPDLFVCVTSNYQLSPQGRATLTACKAFANLQEIHVEPLEGDERRALATSLLHSHLCKARTGLHGAAGDVGDDADRADVRIDLQLGLGAGDVRPLVRHMRSLAVYARHLLSSAPATATAHVLSITEEAALGTDGSSFSSPITLALTAVAPDGADSVDTVRQLVVEAAPSEMGGGLTPSDGRLLHPSSHVLVTKLGDSGASGGGATSNDTHAPSTLAGIARVVDLFLLDALAPAVILCTATPSAERAADALLDGMVEAWSKLPLGEGGIGVIRGVDVSSVKMNRSLYDPRDARSLRDEILDLRLTCPRVVVELLCPTADEELAIREMVEDSPSVVAHSVHKRILYKDGLLFVVRTGALTVEAITPEVRSRASVVL